MELFALVGSSGTGKSYKAMNLCHEKNIEFLIDDGILISGQRKIAGSSAKREKTKVAAVKRAIFYFEDYQEEMKVALKEANPDKLLIIGTSEKMVHQIANNLEIEPIDHIVYIEDIATKEEIETAKFHRAHYGKHVIPLPTVEVKKDFSGYFLDSLKIFSRVFGRKDKIIEKSVVRPTFSFIGQYTISNKTIIQITTRSMKMINGVSRIQRIRLMKKPECISFEIEMTTKNGFNVHTVGYKAIEQIKKYVELMTQLNVETIDITIKGIDF
ncbi:MAG: hypothetical protein JXR88_13795 [Clostridia bacterium]|nr:hypothetical protein [Clostridia bacterium]